MTLLTKTLETVVARQKSPDHGDELVGLIIDSNERYVQLRVEYRKLISALMPDLVLISRARAQIELIEEDMRSQRQSRQRTVCESKR